MRTDRRTGTHDVGNSPSWLVCETVLKVILIYWECKLIINLSYDEDILTSQDLFTYSCNPNFLQQCASCEQTARPNSLV